MTPGVRILLGTLLFGAIGAGIVSIGMPPGIAPNDQLTLEFAAFLFLSGVGAVGLRCQHPFADWGCLTGPLLGVGWLFVCLWLLDQVPMVASGAVLGVLILLCVIASTWTSLPTLALLDLLGFGLYALGLGAAGVYVATRWPVSNGLALSLITAVYAVGALTVTILAHSIGRPRTSSAPLQTPPRAEPPLRRAAHSLQPPDPPAHSLPEGASPPPARQFVRTDGTRAFCCGGDPFPAWLFQDGHWQQLTLLGHQHDMEWPQAVGTDDSGRVFLKTRADVSYDAHIEESIWCDCWYLVTGLEAREVEPTPPIRDWWGDGAAR